MEREDSDTEQALQLQRDEYARRLQARLQEEREISALIEDVYRDAWTDFYAEEPQQCAQLLTSLAATVPKRPAASHMQTQRDDSDDQEMQVDSLETHDNIVVFSAESPYGKELKVQCDIQMAEVASFAYPKYESCTPAIDNILYDGDPCVLAFIPYADEPAFAEHVKTYTELYPELAWQSNWYDVDLNLIAADAYLRVDAAGLEPDLLERFKPRFLPSRATVESSLRKRDICGWGNESLRPPATSSDGPAVGLLAAVNAMTGVFCRSLTCNTAKCMIHGMGSHPVVLAAPEESNEEMHEDIKKGCKEQCCSILEMQYFLDNPLQEAAVDQDICDILKLFPDKRPCALAPLVRSTCTNVFLHRCFLFHDGVEYIPEQAADPAGDAVDPGYCNHAGSCRVVHCVCLIARRNCDRRCRCAKSSCPEQRKGCTAECELTGCRLNRDCPCVYPEASSMPEELAETDVAFECDPEVCKSSSKRRKKRKHNQHVCHNMHAQEGRVANVSVQIGSWGLGTFAQAKILKDSFVGEYVAEKTPDTPDDEQAAQIEQAREVVNKYRKLNYVFDLPGTPCGFDAATVGNPMRCLNDPMDKQKANVTAITKVVGGQPRILFFAAKEIQPKQELLLWYGENYWR